MKKGLIKKVVACALLGIMTMGFVGCGVADNKTTDGNKGEGKDLLNTIQEKGKVVVGMSADYAPYEFHYIDENGKDVIGGFDVDIANEIADALGVDLVIQEMDFDALVAALPAGKVDLVISGMNPTEERAKVVDFSEIYYNSKHGILVRSEDADKFKTFKDLEGVKVGVQLGSTQEQIAKAEIPNVDLQQLANVNNLILELKAGKVDAIVMEKPVAEMAVKSNPELAVGEPTYEEKTGGNAVGVAKNNEQLLAKVNEVIKELNETGKMDEYIVKANELAGSVKIVGEDE
ncbi:MULTISPECIES: transporter substrate-binding domain-containing protein [unclassified Clostridium]|jgi:ABC-type amino acid transport substrate-binding protein|uniref:transporter substrate-binding domain-containing protein n=1 Tax=Clostridium TaxID=1485 RepID=UPI001C8B833C|nr:MULTISPECIES: transporter substrate-binding domain-containing protein [unclassified Clostridium]MBX9136315.1 transporter substrate-binding domain-containing protein [Clostridium sp. K12(2020)]MBX9143413.1 transporter substrate-binding domain-containing protein [Clostridium sp. K13]MDU2290989.1 transporter substrate-binding domain-containing protein [Clostridium celatum]MDU4323821.1 transporter substrate-binding domain-containing protein [Clostridium celatum]